MKKIKLSKKSQIILGSIVVIAAAAYGIILVVRKAARKKALAVAESISSNGSDKFLSYLDELLSPKETDVFKSALVRFQRSDAADNSLAVDQAINRAAKLGTPEEVEIYSHILWGLNEAGKISSWKFAALAVDKVFMYGDLKLL